MFIISFSKVIFTTLSNFTSHFYMRNDELKEKLSVILTQNCNKIPAIL